MERQFQRMQGLGNIFVVFKGPLGLSAKDVIEYSKKYGDDGVLVVSAIGNDLLR